MIKKLKLGSTVAALLLFFLPWIDIQCSGKSIATQTGVQATYGGMSLSDDMKSLGDKKTSGSSEKKDTPKSAIITALALLVVLVACVFAYLSFAGSNPFADKMASILPAVALSLLFLQMIVGFPIKNDLQESMSPKDEQSSGDELGNSMAVAAKMSIDAKLTFSFYLTLLALAVPTGLLINDQLEKRRKDTASGFDS